MSDARRAQEESAARQAAAAKAKGEAEAQLKARVAAVSGAQALRDIPGGVDHKTVGSARDWKTKEKLKRDRGQAIGGSYEQEEKRLLREAEAGGM
jgi:hypothetical protein